MPRPRRQPHADRRPRCYRPLSAMLCRMTDDPDRHHRRSVRLWGYDYAQSGAYFVTVCTAERQPILGTLTNGSMRLSPAGELALDAWLRIDEVNSHIVLDELFIMPDHLHGIVMIRDDQETAETMLPTLGVLIGQFKTHSARRINRMRGMTGRSVWQRSFYEHIIRDDEDLARVRAYVVNNRWQLSEQHEPLGKLVPD